MDEVYNLHQHSHHVSIQLETGRICCRSSSNMVRTFGDRRREKYGISDYVIYDKQKKEIVYWEHPSISKESLEQQVDQLKQQKNKDHIVVDNFIEKVYLAFKKGNSHWSKDDFILEQVVIEFIRLLVDSMTGDEKPIESVDSLHYICVVPSMWEYEIRENLLRPIFVKSGLISKTDHKDRLLFLSDVESLFYFTQCDQSTVAKLTSGYYKVGDHYILCRLNILGASAASSINLDLIEAQHTLFNISDGLLYPRVMSSPSSLPITEDGIKITLKIFLKSVVFSGDISSHQSNVVLMITDYIYSSIRSRMTIFHYPDTVVDNLKMPWITIDAKWKLNKSQTDCLKTLNMFDICIVIGETVLDAMKALFTNSKTKQCRVLLFYENMFIQHKTVFLWARAIIESITYSLNYLSSKNEKSVRLNYGRNNVLIGAAYYFIDVIQNSDINSRPRILPSKELALSTSVFTRPKVNAILNIDISLTSTLLSYILFNENRSIETKPNNNNCGFNKCLPPLESFCKFSDATTLTVTEKCITLIDSYLNDDLNYLFVPEYYTQKMKKLIIEFKDIFEKSHVIKENLVSTQKPEYIQAFVTMYFIYINQLVLSSKHQNVANNTGLLISIEKKLLDCIIGTKQNLKEFLLKSGLLQKNDANTKLKITTHGDSLFPYIQEQCKLEFPIKSCFVLAQLHENYIQLTLKQIVTGFSSKEAQEDITLKDKIVPIQNIYDSLCVNVWNMITLNSSLIQTCKSHYGNDKYLSLDLFSLKGKTKFMDQLRAFISGEILSEEKILKLEEKKIIQFSNTCNCGVSLSIRDIIDISFKPVLQEIASIISASLVNPDFFGKFSDIEYLFSVIYFNNNPYFEHVISNLLTELLIYFNEMKGVDPYISVILKLPNQSDYRQSIYSKMFQIGNLHQISNSSYGFTVETYKKSSKGIEGISYKNKRLENRRINTIDKVSIFMKKGDILDRVGINRVIYCKFPISNTNGLLNIRIYKLYDLEGLDSNGTLPKKLSNEFMSGSSISLKREEYDVEDEFFRDDFSNGANPDNYTMEDMEIPLIICMETKSHLSSIKFSARMVGQDIQPEADGLEVGEPMLLARF